MDKRWVPISPGRRAAAFLLGCLAWFLKPRQDGAAIAALPDAERSVVLLEPYGMGDIISLQPLVRELSRGGWHVTVCGKPAWRPLLCAGSHVDWVDVDLPWTSYGDAQKYAIRGLGGSAMRGSIERMEAVCRGRIGIDPRGDIRSVLLLRRCRCRHVLTLDRYLGTDLPMMRSVAHTVPTDASQRRWLQNMAFLEALGLPRPINPEPPTLGIPGTRLPTVDIALIPVAPWPGRLWPASNWQALVSKFSGRDLRMRGLCGPGQLPVAREALGQGIEVREVQRVEDWMSALTDTRVVVTLDSGSMHLADALGVPLVALFGPGQLPLWAPSRDSSVVVHHQDRTDFRPCHQIERNIPRGLRAMEWIQTDEVEEAVLRLLSV